MLTFNWPNLNQKQPQQVQRQPVFQPFVSPETAQVIQALQRGQRSQVMPMPAPRLTRAPR